MKTRTLSMFYAEKGVSLLEVSGKIGIPAEELEEAEKLHFVPLSIATKIISEYAVPLDYFTENIDTPHKNFSVKRSFGYFFGISFVWTFALNIIISIFNYITPLISSLPFDNKEFFLRVFNTFTNSLIIPAVTIFSCILIARLVMKNNKNAGNFEKYKYFFRIVPMGLIAILNLPVRYVLEKYVISSLSANVFLYTTVVNIVSVISFFCTVLITAAMMNAAFGEPNDSKQKKLDIIFILAFALNTLYYILCVLLFSKDMFVFHELTMAIYNIVLFGVVVLGGFFGMKKKPEMNKIWCTILPLGYYAINSLFSIVLAITSP